ncbi:MAG: YihY/virulence factor BrkB family protein [Gammaproteobacteria bacterium]|nr:YihY/virulence factor BrkB family protein [Gammaproteobacteria bacterium]
MDLVANYIKRTAIKQLWENPAAPVWCSRLVLRPARLLYVLLRDLYKGHLTLRAMGLVYTTLLAIVPLLALSFSVLKGFGAHNHIEPFLASFLQPLGTQGETITKNIIGFVDNVKVGVLGSIGLLLLVYTSVSLIQKVEDSFNFIWRSRRTQGFGRTFSGYLTVILVGPLLVFTALGITASVMSTTVVQALLSVEPIGALAYLTGRILPYVLVCTAFAFVYMFVPSAKVRLVSAVLGGVVAGVLWEFVGWGFASFVVSSARYEAIYSGFAVMILFLIWLYVSWLILLIGAQIAFYHQNPEFVTPESYDQPLSHRYREEIGFSVMFLIGDGHLHGTPPLSLENLRRRLAVPSASLEDILQVLTGRGLLRETNQDPITYLPGRDLGGISVAEVLDALRSIAVHGPEDYGHKKMTSSAQAVVTQVEQVLNKHFSSQSLRDILEKQSA